MRGIGTVYGREARCGLTAGLGGWLRRCAPLRACESGAAVCISGLWYARAWWCLCLCAGGQEENAVLMRLDGCVCVHMSHLVN